MKSSGLPAFLLAIAAALVPASTLAEPFPAGQIEIVVPWPAGGTTDVIARMLAQRFSDAWKTSVIVTNRPGGGGTIGAGIVAKAPPDGHTLMLTSISLTITAALQKLSYDPVASFAPITDLTALPMVLVVHPSLPAKNLQEFVALAKAKPGAIDFASASIGTSSHLAGELFKNTAAIDMTHIPFKGNAEALNALLGGHVKVTFGQVPGFIAHIKAGNLRALAVTTGKRVAGLDGVPTIAESGYPDFEINSWLGLFAPAGTPKDIVDRINAETIAMLDAPEVQERIGRDGFQPLGSTPDRFAAYLAGEMARWREVVKAAGLAIPQ